MKIYLNRGEFANQMLDKYFLKEQNNTISDIGAGFGHMKNKIKSLNGFWQPFDYVKKMEETIVWNLNNKAPLNTKKAGIVLFLEVLEHLSNPLLGLQNITNHMDKGGILILTTPNPQCSKNTLNLVLKGELYAFQKKHLQENHVFIPWQHIVEHFLKECGFEILEYGIVDVDYKKRRPVNTKDWIKKRIESLLEWKNPKALGMSYGIVAKKNR